MPKSINKLVGGNKKDIIKKFFVESNKPTSTLPDKSDLKLSYKFSKKQDHEIISPEVAKLHRRSMTDLKFSKFKGTLDVGKTNTSILPDIRMSRDGRQTSMKKLHKIGKLLNIICRLYKIEANE